MEEYQGLVSCRRLGEEELYWAMGQDHQFLISYLEFEVLWGISLSSGDPDLHGISKGLYILARCGTNNQFCGAQSMCLEAGLETSIEALIIYRMFSRVLWLSFTMISGKSP